MIPYIIERAFPSEDIIENNTITIYNNSIKDKIDKNIIDYIIDIMYEFCSNEFGHNIKIISYFDFCNKFWDINGFIIRDWFYIFRVYYFDNKWIEWNIEEHEEEIYKSYVNKYIEIIDK